jgi:hypothetical protein
MMRQEGVPKKVMDWITRQLEGRETVITFDNYTSEPIFIKNGFNQILNFIYGSGCTYLKVILYIILLSSRTYLIGSLNFIQ